MSVLVDTMGFFIHVFMCVRLSVCLFYVCRLDDGPQVKKLSMEDPQAVAQAAIAKFVDKYVCVCCMSVPHGMSVPHVGESRSTRVFLCSFSWSESEHNWACRI